MHDDLADIKKQRSKWIEAINNSSADGYLDIISNDAVWLPPRIEAIKGKANIRVWLKKPFKNFDFNYSVSDISIRIAGNWAVEQATFNSIRKSGENFPPHKGLYTLLWRKGKTGDWLIERYIDLSAEFVKADPESAT